MSALRRSVVVGTAYGLAVTSVETWFSAQRFMELRLPTSPLASTKTALLEVAFGTLIGLVAAPCARLRGGAAWSLAALAVGWTALARYVAPDPSQLRMWAMGPVAGVVLVGLGWLLARRWPRVPWLLATAALAAAITTPVVVEYVRTHGAAPDVVLVVLDTVRAENTSAYGYARATTPTLERLAKEGALFLDATAPSTWSLPSHASLFTGWFASGHGAHDESRHLGPTPPTLAEVLAGAGYETHCFTANPHISDSFGLTRGFRWSDRAYLSGNGGRSFYFIYRVLDLLGVSAEDKGGGDVAGHFETWVATRPAGAPPAFTFLNFLEAHFPYHQVPAEYLARFTSRSRHDLRAVSLEMFGAQFGRPLAPAEAAAAVPPSIDMYDAGILYSDHLLARVVDALARAGKLDDTILVVLADHGEMLGEHGSFGHGAALYQPDLRVPLLVRYPRRVPAGVRVAAPVSTVGVAGTVLELAGVAPPGRLHVGSLLPAIEGRPAGAPVIAERFVLDPPRPGHGSPLSQPDRRYRAYRSGSWKLVETSRGETFLFDLGTDPGEARDLAADRTDEARRLQAELAGWVAALGLPALDAPAGTEAHPAELDPATRERLRALGYVH